MAYIVSQKMKTLVILALASCLISCGNLSTGRYGDSYMPRNVEGPKDKPKVALLGGQVAVGGQVARPGELAYRPNTTILAMLFAAGGPTQFAALKRVKVFRDGKWFELDLTNEKVKKEEFARPDDYIEVPQKNILERLVP